MSTLDPDMGALVADAIRAIGIDLHTDTEVTGFETDDDDHVRAVVTADETFPADIVVLGIGVRPEQRPGARRGHRRSARRGGITTDRRQQTSAEGCGPRATASRRSTASRGEPVAIALGTHANKQGRVAGINATGGVRARSPA